MRGLEHKGFEIHSTSSELYNSTTFTTTQLQTPPSPVHSPLKPRQDLRPLNPHALQLSPINPQRLQNQRRNLRREDPLREFLRLRDPRTAHEASYVPVIGAQSAVLFDLFLGGRVDDSDDGLDDDVGYEGAVDWGAETWIAVVNGMGW